MNRRQKSRARQKEINILYTTTRKRHKRKRYFRTFVWIFAILLCVVGVGYGMHIAGAAIIRRALYENPDYALTTLDVIDAKGDFSQRQVRQAAGLAQGVNIMSLNLRKIQRDVEQLPYVAEAHVERHLPGKIVIRIRERQPVAKLQGKSDLGTMETFYIDRERILIKPRDDETARALPEIIGLKSMELEAGQRLDQPEVCVAINLLKQLESSKFRGDVDVRKIDVAQPLAIKVYTAQDSSITFRLDCLDQQLQRLQEIMDWAQDNNKPPLKTVDLTLDRNVPVTFKVPNPPPAVSPSPTVVPTGNL